MSSRERSLSDKDLLGLLDEPGTWVVRSRPSWVLARGQNLQSALVMAWEQLRANRIVQAIVRLPSDNIVIKPDQIGRLCKYLKLDDGRGKKRPAAVAQSIGERMRESGMPLDDSPGRGDKNGRPAPIDVHVARAYSCAEPYLVCRWSG